MSTDFTAHNVCLDDGSFTKPEVGYSMENYPWFKAARRLLSQVFVGDKSQYRLVDLGCLEGGYAVEFARMGFQVLGVEARQSNIDACEYVKSKTDLPNLSFVRDDVNNIKKYGVFDAAFCCGLLYHLDQPRAFLQAVAAVTRKIAIIQTHFATDDHTTHASGQGGKFHLSELCENEGLVGRWFREYQEDAGVEQKEALRWAAWSNPRSFWIQREYLLQAIHDAGFDTVLEQFDDMEPDIAEGMLRGSYRTKGRGTFIGIKSGSD